MKEILTIFKYVDGENDELFYSSTEPIKLYEYSFSSTRMGSSTISSTLLFPVCLDNLWSGKEYVLFRGTRYFIKNTPSSTKDNTSVLYSHSLEFASETELQLSNVYFIDAVYSGSDVDDKVKTNSTKVIFFGTLAEFATRIEKAISYSGLSGYTIVIDEGVTTDTQQVSFEDRTIFEALQDSFDIYKVPFYFIGKAIHFGYTDNDISQPFKYGFNNELLSIKKNNANYKVITRITGTGGENNIPYYYPNNSPKGNIEAEALASNTVITQADIELVNAEKFSNKVDLGASVVYCHGVPAVQSWTVNGAPDSGGLHNVTIPTYGPVVEKYVFQLSILSAGIFKISFDMWIQYVGTVYPIGDLISRYELKNKATEDSFSLTPIDSDKSTEYFLTPWLTEGDYELEIDFTLRFQGHSEYTYSLTPNIDSDYGWAIIATDGTGKAVELNDIGIEIAKTPSVGDGFTQVSLGSMPTSTVLLPPLYRETSGAERFYDAENNTYVIPGTEDYYQFENEFSDSYPKEHIFSDDSIYPTINGITNAAGQEIGRFLDVAYDTNDSDETDEEGNYLHPYFFVKLPKFDGSWGFNLFDHAIESGEMEIVMTSGNCNGCHFVIGVDEDAQKNLVQVDESGNLLRDADGDVRCGRDGKPGETPQEQQNDTRNNEVWIALKKDTDTFGVIMPNAANNYRPLAADKFVIINILLPQAYIDKAEEKLKDAIIEYMAENNSEKFDFSVSFSRIYLATHPEIAGLLDENARLRITYNGATYSFYVSQYTYKAVADESLPEIGVELSETITVNKGILQNTIDEIKGDIRKINTNIDPAQSMRPYFLLKNQNDETSGIVRFIRGILLGSTSSSNDFGFSTNGSGGFDGVLSKLTLYGGKESENIALNIVNGAVSGLRHTVKRITGDATLTSDDYIVLVSSESATTITLPEIPQNGQIYRIYSTSEEDITIYGNGRAIYRTGSTVALTQSVISASSGLVDIFYSFFGGGWYLSAADTGLFELVNIGTEENPLMAIQAKYGLFSNSFISARGSDPEAGSGGGAGIDMTSVWYALGQPTAEKINVSHIPAIGMDKVTGLQSALATKLESITKPMVEEVLTGTITSHNHDGRYAPLSGGLIPSQYLPSYVDDVLEYASKTAFPATGEAGKIYVALDTNLTYRWGGSAYVEISPSLALGYTSSTAYPGDEGAALAALVEGMKEITDLFDLDADGNVYVTGSRGFYSNSFVSARGSDPGAGSGGGSGVDMESVWYALGQPTSEKINVSHIPLLQQLSGTLTNAQLANSSLSVAGVSVPLGGAVSTEQIASALTAAGYKLTDTVTTLASLGITATAAELNFVDGVTSNIQTQLDGKLNSGLGVSTIGVSGTSLLAWTYNGATRSTVTQAQLRSMLGLGSNAYTSTAYLPLAGGTMTGLLNLKYSRAGLTMLNITNTAGGEVFLRTYSGSTYAGAFTTNHTSYGTAIFNAIARQYLGITNSGVPHFQGNPLLHSGNYTNYTVTKTGGGASGTWPISVTGSSNTLISTTVTAIGNYVRYRQVSGSPSLVGSTAGGGAWGLPSTGPDAEYANGQILRLGWSSNYYTDIFTGPNDFGAAAGLQFRQIVNGKMSSRGWRTLLDSANYTSYAVSLTGAQTISGAKTFTSLVTATGGVYSPKGLFGLTEAQANSYAGSVYYKLAVGQQSPSMGASLLLYRDSTSYQSYIVWSTGSADHVGVGLKNGTIDFDITNHKGAIKLIGQGILTYNNYTLWHAGNDGSGSGLNADLLDGYHSTSFDLATNLGACQDYGCYVIGLMQITDYTTLGNHANGELIFIRQNGNNPAQKIIYSLSTRYGSTNVRFGYLLFSTNSYVMPCTFTYNGKKWAGFCVDSASSYSAGITCIRDGARFGERSTPFLLKFKVSNTGQILNSEVNNSLVVNGSDIIECGVSARSFIGALSGNASSATKLAAARLLWGRSFDGSGDISGNIIVGDAIIHGSVTSNNTRFISSDNASNIYFSVGGLVDLVAEPSCLRRGASNTSETLGTSTYRWANVYAVNGDYSGNMTVSGWINGGLNISIFGSNSDNSDTTRFLTYGHRVEFGGPGYAHVNYYLRPRYGASGETHAGLFIQNASAAASPVFVTTHYFDHNGYAYHSGHVGIGMAPTGNSLDVSGTIHSTTGIWSNGYVSAKGQDTTSDARYKRDVAALPAQAALAVLMRLRPATWAWKDDGRRGAGFVAQEVMGVLPEAVREVGDGEDRHLALNYQMLHAYEVCLLQTHEDELERLRGRVKQLENEIKRIRYGS